MMSVIEPSCAAMIWCRSLCFCELRECENMCNLTKVCMSVKGKRKRMSAEKLKHSRHPASGESCRHYWQNSHNIVDQIHFAAFHSSIQFHSIDGAFSWILLKQMIWGKQTSVSNNMNTFLCFSFRIWYCSCWLTVKLSWLTGTIEKIEPLFRHLWFFYYDKSKCRLSPNTKV